MRPTLDPVPGNARVNRVLPNLREKGGRFAAPLPRNQSTGDPKIRNPWDFRWMDSAEGLLASSRVADAVDRPRVLPAGSPASHDVGQRRHHSRSLEDAEASSTPTVRSRLPARAAKSRTLCSKPHRPSATPSPEGKGRFVGTAGTSFMTRHRTICRPTGSANGHPTVAAPMPSHP